MHTHKHSHHWVIFSMLQSLKNAVKNTVHNYQTQRSFTTTVLRPNNLILKNWIKTTCHRFGQNWSVIVMLNYQMLCFESSKQLNSAKKTPAFTIHNNSDSSSFKVHHGSRLAHFILKTLLPSRSMPLLFAFHTNCCEGSLVLIGWIKEDRAWIY